VVVNFVRGNQERLPQQKESPLLFQHWNISAGEPGQAPGWSCCDTRLYKLCGEAGIEKFCMRALRHTYAAGAIESSMQPQGLQKLLGHTGIKTAMDGYVHVTSKSLDQVVRQFESGRFS